MSKLSHESLEVYQLSIEFVAWSADLIQKASLKGHIQKQFCRAFISVPLNIAEGAGKYRGKDQARFYDVARGSALECGACLDVVVAMKLLTSNEISRGKDLLKSIVAMLTRLADRRAPDRVREEFMVDELEQPVGY